MTLPEPNTPRETAWFAEQMGWTEYPHTDEGCAAANASESSVFIFACGDVSYHLGDELWKCFNPRTSIADAIELADAVEVYFSKDPSELMKSLYGEAVRKYHAWVDLERYQEDEPYWSDNLCTAICEAVRAKGGK